MVISDTFLERAKTFLTVNDGLAQFVGLCNDEVLQNQLDQASQAALNYNFHLAYIFATVRHETMHTFQPIQERGSAEYLSKYWTNLHLRTSLGNKESGDAQRFKGRGYVQLTGRANYSKFGALLNLDLIGNPDLACDSQAAFKILCTGMARGLFTGRSLIQSLPHNIEAGAEKASFTHARSIINGTDHADLIAGYAMQFLSILR